MVGMLLLAMTAWAGPDLQAVAELEWAAAQTEAFRSALEAEDGAVRAAAVRALGRLERQDAQQLAIDALEDEDEAVRQMAATALGHLPTPPATLVQLLKEHPPADGLAARKADQNGVRVRLIRALGRRGTEGEIDALVRLTNEPWPYSAAAAEGLARLHRRGIDPAQGRLALVALLDRVDPRLQRAAAYALRRVGLPEDEAAILAAERHWGRLSDPMASAWLVGALWKRSPSAPLFERAWRRGTQHRLELLWAVGEGDPADLNSIRELAVTGQAPSRLAAIEALGRLGAVEALESLRDAPQLTAEQRAAVIAAVPAASMPSEDVIPEYAAWLASHGKLERCLSALDAEASRVRSSGLWCLERLEHVEAAHDLLSHHDAVVRESVLAWDRVRWSDAELVAQLRVETQSEVVSALLTRLFELGTPLERHRRPLEQLLLRSRRSHDHRVLGLAAELAKRLEVDFVLEGDERREVFLPDGTSTSVAWSAPIIATLDEVRSVRVRTSQGVFTIELEPGIAPLAVAQFTRLVETGFYDGVRWHRVVPSFVAQTGCPRGDGMGGPGWAIRDEVSDAPYRAGAVGFARGLPLHTAGSQWFISTVETPHLVGDYTLFGYVTDGLEVVRRLGPDDVIEEVRLW